MKKEYERLIDEERILLMNGVEIKNYKDLCVDDMNLLDTIIDSFEDGGNAINIEEEYEYIQYGEFEVRRKCKII